MGATSWAAAYKQSGNWNKSKARLRTSLEQLVLSKARVKRASQNWSNQLVAVNPEKQEEHSLTQWQQQKLGECQRQHCCCIHRGKKVESFPKYGVQSFDTSCSSDCQKCQG